MRQAVAGGQVTPFRGGRRRPGAGRGITKPSPFDGCRFEAKLHEAKFMPSGEMRVVILIPDNCADEAAKLRHAYACALEIAVRRGSFS